MDDLPLTQEELDSLFGALDRQDWRRLQEAHAVADEQLRRTRIPGDFPGLESNNSMKR